jgi:hypothetical protein
MGKTVEIYLKEMGLGEAQGFENMTVFPLTWTANGGPEYITLREAIAKGVFKVTEVSHGGSVPDLQVENKGGAAVLLLDGEELAGAKQNRIITTTILVGGKTAVKIPVNCTEQGRWSYVSKEFAESGHQMDRELRRMNMEAVHMSLIDKAGFRGDQHLVWNRVAEVAREANVMSATGAMKDVFDARGSDLDGYLKAFRAVDGQTGLLVFLDGKPAGFDFVSRPAAFAELFPKLVKSYAMEAMLASEHEKRQGRKAKERAAVGGAEARAFLAAAAACDEQKHDSVGLGSYYRYSGRGIVGSALAVADKVVHMAFFGVDGAEDNGGDMVRTSSRRGFRIV